MILTPIAPDALPALLDRFGRALPAVEPARSIFTRIAATLPAGLDGAAAESVRHGEAVALCHAFAIPTVAEEPQAAFSYDGRAIRTISEPSVVIHEVAHYQVAAPDRLGLPDFGLGAGPETGRRAEADAAQCVFGVVRDIEEGLASLLGILWEAELGHPAILAWLEQNWMEGIDRRENCDHFLKMVDALGRHHLIGPDGRPLIASRTTGDTAFFAEFGL